jgi:ketosteroid isomerase-like protein
VTEDSSIQVVRTAYEAMRTRDASTLMALLAHDCVWHDAAVEPDAQHARTYRGHDETLRMLAERAAMTQGSRDLVLEEVFGDGAGHVVAIHHVTARRPDGHILDAREARIFHVENGWSSLYGTVTTTLPRVPRSGLHRLPARAGGHCAGDGGSRARFGIGDEPFG